MSILSINKPIGITSYDVIRKLKNRYPGKKIGHAGTLDPLAEGVLICLIGKEDNKRQSEFMNVSKEYEFEVLFGFETDTYDVLGLVAAQRQYDVKAVRHDLLKHIDLFKGEIKQKVPPFSAVKVKGKPLYRWYLQGKITDVNVPIRTVCVDDIKLLNVYDISKIELKERIEAMVGKVREGFRQQEVLESWSSVLSAEDIKQQGFLIARIFARVSKGTYIRAIAKDLGEQLGIGGCAISLIRTKVGDYTVDKASNID